VRNQQIAASSVLPEQAPIDDPFAIGDMVVGNSKAMQDIATMIRQVALYPTTTILLQGESGTGKDVVARAIHTASRLAGRTGRMGRRSAYEFVDINCAAIPETLLETELFGVEMGAYTDAKMTRAGYLLRADGGTLFLDEIGSMPLVLQAKLLRFLETRSFRRVGSTKEIHVDLRVISATNLNLQVAVAHKLFREDLLYRLKVITLYLPPLRERVEDIELLIEHFLRLHSIVGEPPLRISAEAKELLLRYSWPGNVRQLRSVIQRGQILCDSHEICPQHLPLEIRKAGSSAAQRLQELQQDITLPPEGVDLPAFLATIERKFVLEALQYCNGNQVRAAALLHMSRDQLRYRM
jgi:two-component system, NtrC family, response regulator AtoC